LKEKLQLTLSNEKILIIHANSPAKFLGYEIFIRLPNEKPPFYQQNNQSLTNEKPIKSP
jgi:hypothetical protein